MEQAPHPGYRERLWPSPAFWALVPADTLLLALIFIPVGPVAVAVAGAVGGLVTLALLIRGAATVAVADGQLLAGAARIPVHLLGPAEPLDAGAMRRARGTELDARAYLCLRGWLQQGVRVPVRDQADPTPYWLISSRRPTMLVRALSDQPDNRAADQPDNPPADRPGTGHD